MHNVGLGKRAAVRRELEEIADAFRDLYPQIYAEAVEAAESARKELAVPSGMSKEGMFMSRLTMPGEIHAFIKHRMGVHFFQDPENCEMVRKVFCQLSVGETENKRPFTGIGEGTLKENKSNAAPTSADE
jgi:hypothetical protein